MQKHIACSPLVLALVVSCAPSTRYQRILDEVEGPGVQMAVVEASGDLWLGASGVAAEGVSMTPDHAFLIGSNTKMMTAAIVLQLVEEGALELDDSASTWVPELEPEVRVRDLLQHTSGIGEYFEDPRFDDPDSPAFTESWDPHELIALGLDLHAEGPTETAVYSNSNYLAAGLVVEGVEGRPFDEVIEDRIFDRLGMTGSGFLVSGDPTPEHLAYGEGGELGGHTRWDPSVGWAAGSAYATAEDMIVFIDAMSGGELYGDELVAEQRDYVPADLGIDAEGIDTYYGLGLMVVEAEGQWIHGHLGGVDGYTSSVMIDPSSGAIGVLLVNTQSTDPVTPVMDALKIAARH